MGWGLRFLALFFSLQAVAGTTVNFSNIPAKMMGFGSFAKDIQKLVSPELNHYGKTLGAFFSAPEQVQALMVSDAYIKELSHLNSQMGEMEFVHVVSADISESQVQVNFQIWKYNTLASTGAIVGTWTGKSPVSVTDVRIVR